MKNPKENRFLHSLPSRPVAPALKPTAPETPHAIPAHGPKRPPRWSRLQEYLSKSVVPAHPIAPPTEEEPEK